LLSFPRRLDPPVRHFTLHGRRLAPDVDPNDPARYELLEQSVKYSTERPYPCVRYQSIVRDNGAHGTVGPQLLEMDGLYCRHPADASTGAVIMYSHRGVERHASLGTEAQAFIRNAVLLVPK